MARRYRRRWLPRPVSILLAFLLFGGLGWAAVYAYDRGFSSKWRRFVQEEFRRRGVEFDFKRLTIDPVEGVVARDVRIFEGPDRDHVLAAIDQVTVDLDLAKAFNKDLVVRSLDLEKADLFLPIDPENPDSETIKVTDLSARARFADGRIELGSMQGDLYGLRFSVSGDLLLPTDDKNDDDDDDKTDEEKLEEIRERRSRIAEILKQIPRIRLTGEDPPTIDLEVYGSLDEPELIDGNIEFRSQGLEYEGFAFDRIEIDAEARDGAFELRKLLATTAKAERLEASAAWAGGSSPVNFHLKSEMNLVELVRHVKPIPALAEVVFFSEAPQLSVEGSVTLPQLKAEGGEADSEDGEEAESGLVVKALGQLEVGRFSSRGEIFQRARVDFNLDGDRYYLRNGRIEHLSGDLRFQAMQTEDGFRIRASSTLDPSVARRFANHSSTREVIDAFHFGKEPSVLLTLEATGESMDSRTWHSKGHLDLRDFEMKGVPFLHIDAKMESKNDILWFSDVFVERPEGNARAEMIEVNSPARRVTIRNLKGTLDPVATVKPFNEGVSRNLARYRWAQTPSFELGGVIDTRRTAEQTNLTCRFQSNGTAAFEFLGQDLVFPSLLGEVTFLQKDVDLQLQGELFGGTILNRSKFAPGNRFSTRVIAENMSFEALADTYFGGSKTKGTLGLNATMKGLTNDARSLEGVGEISLTNGDLFAVPALGPISKLLSGLLKDPRAGYSVAREAKATYNFAEGVARTTDFEALTPGFKLNLRGDIDALDDELSLDAKIRLRGPGGILLNNPITGSLLEFEGQGSFKDVEWAPKRLVRPLGGDAPSLRKNE